MKLLRRSSLLLAYCLAALAGYIDALGFIHIGGYFVSFMSGNSTRLAVHLAKGNDLAVIFLLQIILGFMLGAMLGRFTGHAAGIFKRSAILLSVSTLLLFASVFSEFGVSNISIFCMTLAMGAVNEVFQKDGKIVVAVTYMTGALVLVGQKIAGAFLGTDDRYGWLPPLLLWLSLVTGGLAGGLIYSKLGLHGLWLSVVFSFSLAFIHRRHHHEGDYL